MPLLGAGAFKLGIAGGFLGTVTYAVIGGLVGILCGKPPWRQDTIWTTTLKGIFGAVVGGALYWGRQALRRRRTWPSPPSSAPRPPLHRSPGR